jgi:hypothetical protein
MTMNELAQFATNEQMIPNAPIQAASSIQIAAPLKKVWSLLIGVSDWERWYPYLKNPSLKGTFSAQTPLTYGGFIRHKLRIAKVIPEELVMLYGTMAGYKGITRWNVTRVSGTQTEVSFTESSSGFLIGTLYSNQKLGEHLQHWLDALKAQAERSA